MTLCPVALAVGCRKCPVFGICPAKGLIGDHRPDDVAVRETPAASPKKKKAAQK